MNKRKLRNGAILLIALVFLSLIILVVSVIIVRGIATQGMSTQLQRGKKAVYAAEAGIARALIKYRRGEADFEGSLSVDEHNGINAPSADGVPDWIQDCGTASQPRNLTPELDFYVEATSNLSGTADITAPNGMVVRPRMIYYLATGIYYLSPQDKVGSRKIIKQVGVLINWDRIPRYALASAGGVSVKNADIYGNVKCDGNLHIEAQLDMYPGDGGDGRVLCGSDIIHQSHRIEMNSKQDVRARGMIDGVRSKIIGESEVSEYDTTPATNHFVHDGSLKPSIDPDSEYTTLPNPDMNALLPAGGYTRDDLAAFGGTPVNLVASNNNKTLYFPNGVTIGNVDNDWKGTIVAGKPGSPGKIEFTKPISACEINAIAVDGGDLCSLCSTSPCSCSPQNWPGNGTKGGSEISFRVSANITGMVYAHGAVLSSGANFYLYGTLIAYNDNVLIDGKTGFIGMGAKCEIHLSPIYSASGFDNWLAGPGSGDVKIASWERY